MPKVWFFVMVKHKFVILCFFLLMYDFVLLIFQSEIKQVNGQAFEPLFISLPLIFIYPVGSRIRGESIKKSLAIRKVISSVFGFYIALSFIFDTILLLIGNMDLLEYGMLAVTIAVTFVIGWHEKFSSLYLVLVINIAFLAAADFLFDKFLMPYFLQK